MDTPATQTPSAPPDAAGLPLPAPGQGLAAGYLLAAGGAILFSAKAVIIKFAYREGVDAETLLALRMIFSIPFYLVIGAWSVHDRVRAGRPLPGRRLVVSALLIGLLGYWIASYLDFLGLLYVSAQFERLILFTYPLFVVLFGALFFGQPIRSRVLVAVAISYAGLVVIFSESAAGGGRSALLGGFLVLGAAIAFALYQLLAKDVIGRTGPRLFTCIAMSSAAAGAIIQFLLTHAPGDLLVGRTVLLQSVLLAIGATVLPSFMLNAALHRISAQANATIGTLSPVATILMAYAFLGETLSPAAILGTALVLAGVGWFTLAERR